MRFLFKRYQISLPLAFGSNAKSHADVSREKETP